MEVEQRTISSADKRNAQQKTSDYKNEYNQLLDTVATAVQLVSLWCN